MDYVYGGWIILSSIVTVASIIANWTPTDKDNKVIKKVKEIMKLLAVNFNFEAKTEKKK